MVLAILGALLTLPSLAGSCDLGVGTGRSILGTLPFEAPVWVVSAQVVAKEPGIVTGKKPKSVPELDPSAAGAAAVLILGGTLVTTGHRRRPAARLSRDSASPQFS